MMSMIWHFLPADTDLNSNRKSTRIAVHSVRKIIYLSLYALVHSEKF